MLERICEHYGISVELLLSGVSRGNPNVKKAMKVACAVLRRQGYSWTSVGRMVRRDHSSVIYSSHQGELSYKDEIDMFCPTKIVRPVNVKRENQYTYRPPMKIEKVIVVEEVSPYEHLFNEKVNAGKDYAQYMKDEKNRIKKHTQ